MCSKSASTSEFGASASWLVHDGHVLASLEIPTTRHGRSRGLLGRDSFEGAMLIRPARTVHTIGMKFNLDVALLDGDGTVIKTLTLRRNRIAAPIWRARAVLEAEAGAFRSWGLRIGDVLEIRTAEENDIEDPG